MPRIPLGAAYHATSAIAGFLRCVNLYSERNEGGPTEFTLYPRPGRTPLSNPPILGNGRCLYVATNGDVYAVVGQTLYYIDPNYVWHALAALPNPVVQNTPVYIADNGVNALVVDGSIYGLSINLSTRVAMQIADPNFLGANRVTFLNFFLLLNELNSPNFYSTQATSIVFNALFFGSLTQWPGNCIALIATEAALWLFSQQKGEVWADAGTSPFAFQPLSGVIIEHGIAGPYALSRYDVNVYWLSQSPEGARIAMRGYANVAQRISTHAIEQEWLTYPTVSDCIVTTLQVRGHAFVFYDFPTADRTWVFDESNPADPWHEEAYYDFNGVQHRMKDTFKVFAYQKNLSLDWATGALYHVDTTNYSDNGVAQFYQRDVSHILDEEDDRVTIWRVEGDMECGNGTGVPLALPNSPWSLGFNAGFGPQQLTEPPYMTLLISHDRGKTFFAHSDQLMAGQYGFNTKPTFNRCGVAFDTVLRFQWTGPFKTAMNAPFVVLEKHEADV